MPLTLTKHHGLGNDFLVVLDRGNELGGHSAVLATRLCDRRRGVGADGLIRVTPGGDGTDVTMELRNADGGRAEMSGNGIRCLAQAVVDAGLAQGPHVSVTTDAGVKSLIVHGEHDRGERTIEVDMGLARLGPDQPQDCADRFARAVNMGNPHLVLVGPDPATVDVATLGAEIESVHTGGVNVEFVMVGPDEGAVTMRVWERGVGETMACGTGACAAAAAAHSWGLVGTEVLVHQPGGTARVELSEADSEAAGDTPGPYRVRLVGPTRHIATIEIPDWELPWR